MCCWILRFLIAAMHGPCPGNQLLVARSELLNSIILVIPAPPCLTERREVEESRGTHRTLSALACDVLEAVLEGGAVDYDDLRRHLELNTIYAHARRLNAEVQGMYKKALRETRSLSKEEESKRDLICDTLTKIYTIKQQLDPATDNSVMASGSNQHFGGETDLVGTVEIVVGNRVHQCFFPMPVQVSFLSQETKRNFLKSMALGTTEQRMGQLIDDAKGKWDIEMHSIRYIMLNSRLYQTIHRNIGVIRPALFLLVIMINLNVLMSSPRISEPVNVLLNGPVDTTRNENGGDVDDDAVDARELTSDEEFSLYLTFLLGIINFLGYLVVMAHGAATEVPMTVKSTDLLVKRRKISELQLNAQIEHNLPPDATEDEIDEERERLLREEKKSWHNLGAFDLWGVTLAVNVLFIIMHRVNYPEQESYPIYAFLIFGINLPWTLSCIRNYIVVPSRWGERVFIIIWDVLMRREFMRTHIILLAISTAGFQANRCELVVD
jgi:hypothetical protein